jgi:hypothetical protein
MGVVCCGLQNVVLLQAAAELGLTLPVKRLSTDAPMQDAKKPRHISGQSVSALVVIIWACSKSEIAIVVGFLLTDLYVLCIIYRGQYQQRQISRSTSRIVMTRSTFSSRWHAR